MKKALISPVEPRADGFRVAQIVAAEDVFEVAAPLFWTNCDDSVVADQFWFDPLKDAYVAFPVYPAEAVTGVAAALDQPVAAGVVAL